MVEQVKLAYASLDIVSYAHIVMCIYCEYTGAQEA